MPDRIDCGRLCWTKSPVISIEEVETKSGSVKSRRIAPGWWLTLLVGKDHHGEDEAQEQMEDVLRQHRDAGRWTVY